MHDYMRALQQRFFQKPQCEEIRQTVDTTSKELFTRMGDEDKRKLLLIVDSTDAIRDEVSLASFMAGFKLAWGISRELETDGLYSYDEEEMTQPWWRSQEED